MTKDRLYTGLGNQSKRRVGNEGSFRERIDEKGKQAKREVEPSFTSLFEPASPCNCRLLAAICSETAGTPDLCLG